MIEFGTTPTSSPDDVVFPSSGESGRAIQLRRYDVRQANHWHLRGFRIRVVVVVAVDMPKEIFVFGRSPVNPNTGDQTDTFLTVASFPDLAAYPVDAPDDSSGLPYFRKAEVELDLRSTRDVEATWSLLRQQACVLRDALDRADRLIVTETVWCGTPPDEPSSDSSDSSESASA